MVVSTIKTDPKIDPRSGRKTDPVTIGLVVPFATDEVPAEGAIMYPGMRFIPRGVGVKALTPEGYESAFNAIIPAAEQLAAQGVAAIMVIGTSLTFYRGPEAHGRLLEELRNRTGLPVSTMSQAIVDGLREVGARHVAVATAYSDVVNRRLKELLVAAGIDVLALECFDILEFGGPGKKSEADIIALSDSAVTKAGGADGILISCGGLRTLSVAQPLEASHRIPVVSSTPAAFWAAMRLVGESGRLSGYGQMLAQAKQPVQ
jgi:arylmalonate decarboxylase